MVNETTLEANITSPALNLTSLSNFTELGSNHSTNTSFGEGFIDFMNASNETHYSNDTNKWTDSS